MDLEQALKEAEAREKKILVLLAQVILRLDSRRSRGLSTRQAAKYLGVSVRWLQFDRLESNPKPAGPAFKRVNSKTLVYLREDLDAWLEGLGQ